MTRRKFISKFKTKFYIILNNDNISEEKPIITWDHDPLRRITLPF